MCKFEIFHLGFFDFGMYNWGLLCVSKFEILHFGFFNCAIYNRDLLCTLAARAFNVVYLKSCNWDSLILFDYARV